MKNSVMLSLLYWQILQAKYTLNPNTRSAFSRINAKIESFLTKIPAPLNLWRKLTGMLYSMVDPERMRQQAQAGQEGASSGRGCAVM